ncbi:hypothetical protein RND71_007900 [Anisodus tanguticus]|uniref:F-box domain-containing protein n=1 Tax=Anisodus tanguticus TaxID=243964 RepID=A0AAE1SPT9_9SOLA|nr:hypothetical protein RND71_007900 [Anisodus tanguticus]
MSKAEKMLSEEIIIDILYRLPAKSIGRCRCLSKQWCNFLSDPQFIKYHLSLHAHKQEEKLILVSWYRELHTITFNHNPLNEIDGISRKLHFQFPDNWITVAGSCNGLVLVVDRQNITFLINPTTLKYHKVPIFDLSLPQRDSCIMYGLGDEKFLDLPGPTENNYYMCNLVAIRGCLCVSTNISKDIDTITFWMMKEYGVKESWTKFKITEPNLDDSLGTLLCSINDDDVLLDVDEELAVYNMKENKRRDLMIDVTPVIKLKRKNRGKKVEDRPTEKICAENQRKGKSVQKTRGKKKQRKEATPFIASRLSVAFPLCHRLKPKWRRTVASLRGARLSQHCLMHTMMLYTIQEIYACNVDK